MARAALGRPALLLLVGSAVLLVPVLNRLVPEGSAFHLEDRLVPLFGKYLAYAVLAVALDLVWGRAGILSLGHGAFFALGGYAMGMYLMRQIGPRGVYAHPVLPDFMVFLNWQELPWYWYGFDRFPFALAMVVLVPGTLAFVFGWLAFRSRVSGVYLSIITQALTYALMLAFFRNDMGFGGNNGLTDFKDILGFPIASPDTRLGLYLATGVLLVLALAVAIHLRRSPLGRLLVAIRDGEPRARFLGHDTLRAKLFVWTLTAVLAGLAGALNVAGRHHQPLRVQPRGLDRDRHLGRGRRPRHDPRAGARRFPGQRHEDLAHRRGTRALALRPGWALRPRDPGVAQGPRRDRRAAAAAARPAEAVRG